MIRRPESDARSEDAPQWYKDAIIYELHVRAFRDSNGDGIGDFQGLGEKLDYLQDLGVTALWLLPFYPSPLRDDGYDIADYNDVHDDYGNLADFKRFLKEAHRRGLRVITELVINHTSDQHPWFQKARHAKPGSAARDFYVWSDKPDRYQDARIIFQDFESSNWAWDPVAKAYYWHRFYTQQPDLNFDNPAVRQAVMKKMDFWFKMGVDGMRLDAVPYLFEREGTNCENLPETHELLKELRKHVDENHDGKMLLAEANQWPEDSVTYFGDGDECHMCFHFPVMPRLFMAIRMEDRFPILDILDQTPDIPESCQWAVFLRNHDELTLEMVTDEERDYMWRVYAHDQRARVNLGIRRRLAPLLENDRRKIELMNALLFSMPGTPVLYYGDEIGMGDNIYLGDRNAVRTPMQWSTDRNAGFSEANPQKLYLPIIIDPQYHYESINVEAQQASPHSLYWWTRRLIGLRKRFRAFGRGDLEFLQPENPKVLVFLRRFEDETLLIVANLSRHAQYVELDLSEMAGAKPVELFGQMEFPEITEDPTVLTLGAYGFFWFSLEPQQEPAETTSVPRLRLGKEPWDSLLQGRGQSRLATALDAYLKPRRWFRGKAREIKRVEIVDSMALPGTQPVSRFAFVEVEYSAGENDLYLLPIGFVPEAQAEEWETEKPYALIARLEGERPGYLIDATSEATFSQKLLELFTRRRGAKSHKGELEAQLRQTVRQQLNKEDLPEAEPSVAEQSNSSLVFDHRFIVKLFRELEPGLNPELELGQFLTKHGFEHVAPVLGSLHWQNGAERSVLAILQQYVPNEGDAWSYGLDSLRRFFERALAAPDEADAMKPPAKSPVTQIDDPIPHATQHLIGVFLERMTLLGQRTAELHQALASEPAEPDFSPEPYGQLSKRSLYQAMRTQHRQSFELLRKNRRHLNEGMKATVEETLALSGDIESCLRRVLDRRIESVRIRCHGDYHLGQVLFTGSDFVIIDFEGEPARSLGERRLKRSPLRDVAGMLRSFDYAAHVVLEEQVLRGGIQAEELERIRPWSRAAAYWSSVAFLKGYQSVAGGTDLVPEDRDLHALFLDAFLIDKALYEVSYELNNRPDWLGVPLGSLQDLVARSEKS
ncbi:MAG: maltose alpha-D-glucosyltransferase [Planctomycetota bacterium]